MADTSFDFEGFRAAFTARDAETAEWIEYRHADPPSRPNVMRGRAEIADFISRIATAQLTLSIDDWLVDGDRMVFRVWVALPDGRRIVEQVFIYTANGRITRQMDVEAWD